jgi:hypothetical protein
MAHFMELKFKFPTTKSNVQILFALLRAFKIYYKVPFLQTNLRSHQNWWTTHAFFLINYWLVIG